MARQFSWLIYFLLRPWLFFVFSLISLHFLGAWSWKTHPHNKLNLQRVWLCSRSRGESFNHFNFYWCHYPGLLWRLFQAMTTFCGSRPIFPPDLPTQAARPALHVPAQNGKMFTTKVNRPKYIHNSHEHTHTHTTVLCEARGLPTKPNQTGELIQMVGWLILSFARGLWVRFSSVTLMAQGVERVSGSLWWKIISQHCGIVMSGMKFFEIIENCSLGSR